MSCSTHIHIEYFDTYYKRDKNGRLKPIKKWRCADWFRLNKYYGDKGESKYKQVPLWEDKVYNLFTILAGIRNNNINPISESRGIPLDISNEVLKDYRDCCNNDLYSPSYFTLQELIDFVNDNQNAFGDLIFQDSIYYLTNLIGIIKTHIESDGFICDYDKVNLSHNTLNDVRIVFWFDN